MCPASFSGNKDSYGFILHLTKAEPPTNRPDCRVSNTNAPPTANGLREPVTAITTDPFSVTYNRCDGFVDPPPQRTLLTETTQLTITKQ